MDLNHAAGIDWHALSAVAAGVGLVVAGVRWLMGLGRKQQQLDDALAKMVDQDREIASLQKRVAEIGMRTKRHSGD